MNNECCVTRTSLSTCIRMDTRDDPLVPAHGLLLSGSHSLAANMRGHYSHMVGSLQCNQKIRLLPFFYIFTVLNTGTLKHKIKQYYSHLKCFNLSVSVATMYCVVQLSHIVPVECTYFM